MNITKPTLLLDEAKCRSNIARMAKKARESEVEFRPHFKTHQSRMVAEWYREYGVNKITVSSVDMARYFSSDFEHITIAIPVNLRQIGEINELLAITDLSVLVDDPNILPNLDRSVHSKLGCWIEVDTGSRRTGLDPRNTELVRSMLHQIQKSSNLTCSGLYSHPGHTYGSSNRSQIISVYNKALEDMLKLRHSVPELNNLPVNIGDTPGCSTAENFAQIESISPGNFVFFDVTQAHIGSCLEEEIAVCMACPVISTNPDRSELVVYGGGIHFSKDRIDLDGTTCFGKVVDLSGDGWGASLPDCSVRSLSQEHGVVKVSAEVLDRYAIGDVIGILPVHSCMTADCMGHYSLLSGKQVDHMRSSR